MTTVSEAIISPAISTTLDKLVLCLASGADAVLVGPVGCGLSAIVQLSSLALRDKNFPFVLMDCRAMVPWQEAYRVACNHANDILSSTKRLPVLAIDHCGDLESQDVIDLYRTITSNTNGSAYARLWVGNLDCRCLETEYGLPIIRDPQSFFLMPEYHRDDLLRIYFAIGKGRECEWGEAIHYFLHDWCGSDLALVDGLAAYLYGNWKEHLYDESVCDCLDRWLAADSIVQKYRQSLNALQEPSLKYIRLLCSGGKVPCHAPGIEHETDGALRDLYFRGFITANLIPGFYQFRNLTVNLLAMQTHAGTGITSASLLRKSSNMRVNAIIQDIEVSLRYLIARCFATIGIQETKRRLEATKTDEQPMTSEARKWLLEWARQTGSEDLQRDLTRHLTAYTREFYRTRNLWTRVCDLHLKEVGGDGGSIQEPPLEKIADYLTFNELSALVLGLCPNTFPKWKTEIRGRQSPAKRWPAHLARVERLRNQSAHLRNVTFQDMEDLLKTAEEMRRDMLEYV